jgi:branched-chain amino acid transport system substrate-binding protein
LAFAKLINVDKVDVILGSTCSGATLAGMPLLPKAKIPAMTYASSNVKISQQSGVGGNEYMWRMNIDEGMIAEYGVKYVADQNQKNVALLVENNDYGRGAAEVYAPLLPKYGITLQTTEYFDVGTNDLRPQITKINALKPDAVLLISEPPECALFARQQAELGIHLALSGRGGCTTPTGLAAVGDVALVEGAVDFDYWAVTDKQPFIKAWEALYTEPVDYNAALAYYAMYTLSYAIKAGGPGPEGIEKGLALVDWQSPIGQIKFDDHHQAHPNLFIIAVQNGKAVVLTEMPTE